MQISRMDMRSFNERIKSKTLLSELFYLNFYLLNKLRITIHISYYVPKITFFYADKLKMDMRSSRRFLTSGIVFDNFQLVESLKNKFRLVELSFNDFTSWKSSKNMF